MRLALFTSICISVVAAANAQNRPGENPAEALEMPTVVVVGTTPLPGLGTPLRDVPANVQIYTSKDLAGQRQATATDYLEQNPTGISSNAAQGNLFQPDITFRGFSASALLDFNFGVVGENFFTGPDRTFGPAAGVDPAAEQFRGPGAPRGVWVGVRYSFGDRSGAADEQ